MDVNCPIVHPFHMSICSPSAFPAREIIIDHIHASNTQKQHGAKYLRPCHHHGECDSGRKLKDRKKWTSCRRGNYMQRKGNIWRHFKKALAVPAVSISGPHPPLPPNTLISYSQRPVWHDRPLTPQMAALQNKYKYKYRYKSVWQEKLLTPFLPDRQQTTFLDIFSLSLAGLCSLYQSFIQSSS